MRLKVAGVVSLFAKGNFMKNIFIDKENFIELIANAYMAGHSGYADQALDFAENLLEDYLKTSELNDSINKIKLNDLNEISLLDNQENNNVVYSSSISDQSIIVSASIDHTDPVIYATSQYTGLESFSIEENTV